jgi:S-methylmethionine-dependent homocysteine/selenocysteine methylase
MPLPRTPIVELCRSGAVLLTDGGIETRLIYEFGCALPDFASFLPLFRPAQRPALEAIYRSYLDVAKDSGLPMQLGTPTWRAHPDSLARLGFDRPGDLERVNRAAVEFLANLRAEAGLEDRVYLAGVIGPRRDGYDPAGAPGVEESRDYHAAQARVLAECGVDLLYAPTFAARAELHGVAAAMATTGLPYALAPVIDTAARLPDGTALADAIREIDAAVRPAPLHYLIGCVHPTRFEAAFAHAHPSLAPVAHRIAGLKANASTLPPDQLDKLDHLDAGAPVRFAEEMLALRRDHGLTVLGGCCGTSDKHIRAIAARLAAREAPPPR